MLIYLCAGSSSLPSGDAEGGYQWEVQTQDSWILNWEAPLALTVAEGGTVGHGVTCVSSSVSLPYLRLLFRCKTLCTEI
jgi:hypothetical protein